MNIKSLAFIICILMLPALGAYEYVSSEISTEQLETVSNLELKVIA